MEILIIALFVRQVPIPGPAERVNFVPLGLLRRQSDPIDANHVYQARIKVKWVRDHACPVTMQRKSVRLEAWHPCHGRQPRTRPRKVSRAPFSKK